MRDTIIIAASFVILAIAMTLLAFFSSRVKNHRYANAYLVSVTILAVIASIIAIIAYYEVKQ